MFSQQFFLFTTQQFLSHLKHLIHPSIVVAPWCYTSLSLSLYLLKVLLAIFCFTLRYLSNIDCLSFVMCLLLAPVFQGFFLLWPLTVLIKQTRQAVRSIKQSILLRCLWFYLTWRSHSWIPCSISGYCKSVQFVLDLTNRTVCIRHQCRKTAVLSCHRCLIDTGVEKMLISIQILTLTTRSL